MVNNLKHFDTFQDIVKQYKDLYDIDLSNLKYIEDNVARNNNGTVANIPSDEFGGSWLKNHSIIINPDPEPVIKHYGLSMQAKDFLRHIMAHEMAHDVSYNPKYKDLYKKIVEEAKAKKFTTPYMDVVPEDKYDNELFSEYMAHLINEKKASVYDLPEIQRLEKELAALDYTVPDRTQTIKDILKDKKTSCWGISRIALERLKRTGLDPETVYVAEDDDDMRPTHQFTTYRDGDKYRIFDHWVTQQLLDELYPSREAAIDAGVENWRREGHPHSIRAYTGTYIPKPGKDFEEYMDAIERGNKLLKKYPALEKSGSVYDLPEIQRLEKELSTLDYDWDDPYKTQTIKDILKSRKDHCWGVARLIRNRLRRAQLDPEVVYMKEEEHDGVTPTHQFNTYKDGDDYRVLDYRVDNHSMFPFYGPKGKTREEAILKYLDAWRKEQNSFTGNVDIWTGNYIPKPGKDWYEYMSAIEKGNKLLKKYPALEKQSALLKIAKLLTK